jgi:hypothetical protein
MIGEKMNAFQACARRREWPCVWWPRLRLQVFPDGFPALFPTFTPVEGFGAGTALPLWKVLGGGGEVG